MGNERSKQPHKSNINQLNVYQKLISMGFDETLSWTASLTYNDLGKCIDFITEQMNQSKHSNNNKITTRKIFVGDDECKLHINECDSIQKLTEILQIYSKYDGLTVNNELFEKIIAADYNRQDLMRDYIHAKRCHHHEEHKYFAKLRQCNDECSARTRFTNRSMNRKQSYNTDLHKIILSQSLDTIHCNLLHSDAMSNSSKFVTNIDHKHQMKNVPKHDDIKQYDNLPSYQFGADKNMIMFPKFSTNPKYDTLKDEFLSNKLYKLELFDYLCLYENAKNWMNAYQDHLPVAKRMCRRVVTEYEKRFQSAFVHIKKGDIIQMEQVMVTMSYCNMNELQKNYNNTWKLNPNESRHDVLERQREIGIWSRLMYQTVYFFGNIFKMRNDSVFRGLSTKLRFDMMGTTFGLPTSTTTSVVVAQRFAETADGIIIELRRTMSRDIDNIYLDVHSEYILSDYVNEQERIIFNSTLGFKNIIFDDMYGKI
eukprot:152648_1